MIDKGDDRSVALKADAAMVETRRFLDRRLREQQAAEASALTAMTA